METAISVVDRVKMEAGGQLVIMKPVTKAIRLI